MDHDSWWDSWDNGMIRPHLGLLVHSGVECEAKEMEKASKAGIDL